MLVRDLEEILSYYSTEAEVVFCADGEEFDVVDSPSSPSSSIKKLVLTVKEDSE